MNQRVFNKLSLDWKQRKSEEIWRTISSKIFQVSYHGHIIHATVDNLIQPDSLYVQKYQRKHIGSAFFLRNLLPASLILILILLSSLPCWPTRSPQDHISTWLSPSPYWSNRAGSPPISPESPPLPSSSNLGLSWMPSLATETWVSLILPSDQPHLLLILTSRITKYNWRRAHNIHTWPTTGSHHPNIACLGAPFIQHMPFSPASPPS